MPKNLKLKAARAEKDLTQSALAEAMITLCENADMRRQMGQNGMRRVCAIYQLSTMVERYEALFNEVTGGDRHGGNRV